MDMTRKHVYYRGRVQGVGFRYTTVRVAANFRVTGYVRNTYDGRVEMVAEGQPTEVDAFIADLAEHMGGYITDTGVQDETYIGEFNGFDIRF